MAKMFFNNPIIILGGGMDEPGETEITIPDSAQGGVNQINPVGYSDWLSNGGFDLVSPEGIDEADYVQWWTNMMNAGYSGFTSEAWNSLNPGWTGNTPFTNP